ncbi:MAG TPA: phosphatase PAP2 family protein [Steroidobacteraceae bacterium]|jgi:undecaprenyl-diphosphatase|nr:phosphatase PAP2 family protein [Steroidobacteraceae bacterium]
MWSSTATRIDDIILGPLTSLVGHSAIVDGAMEILSHGNITNGAFVMTIFWWYWFRQSDPVSTQRTHEHLLCTMIASAAALFVARALALTLPFRLRPRFEPTLHLIWPAAPDSMIFVDWSAFPSDHAVMFSALAVGLWFVSWRLGLALLFFAVFIVSLPRVYYGMHYPTDVLAGVGLGALIGYCANASAANRRLAGRMLLWGRRSPQGFYAALFVVTFEFATMFESARWAAHAAFHAFTRH